MMAKVYQTLRFGNLEIRDEDIITLPEGLLGFAQCTRYVILEDEGQAPFQWLQSLDNTDLGFVVVDPLIIMPEYRIQISKEEVKDLQLESPEQGRVFVIVVVPSNLSEVSANLKGPIIINQESRLGKQLVLMDERYPTRYYFMKDMERTEKTEE